MCLGELSSEPAGLQNACNCPYIAMSSSTFSISKQSSRCFKIVSLESRGEQRVSLGPSLHPHDSFTNLFTINFVLLDQIQVQLYKSILVPLHLNQSPVHCFIHNQHVYVLCSSFQNEKNSSSVSGENMPIAMLLNVAHHYIF